MYYVMRASAPSLHRESTDSLISLHNQPTTYTSNGLEATQASGYFRALYSNS